MSAEENKMLVRRFFDAFEANDQATLRTILSPDLVTYLPGDSEPVTREGLLEIIQGWAAAFSNVQFEIGRLITELDAIATVLTLSGVHDRGAFLDIPASGNQFTINLMTFERIQGGRIVERRVVFDLSDLLRQLGAEDASL